MSGKELFSGLRPSYRLTQQRWDKAAEGSIVEVMSGSATKKSDATSRLRTIIENGFNEDVVLTGVDPGTVFPIAACARIFTHQEEWAYRTLLVSNGPWDHETKLAQSRQRLVRGKMGDRAEMGKVKGKEVAVGGSDGLASKRMKADGVQAEGKVGNAELHSNLKQIGLYRKVAAQFFNIIGVGAMIKPSINKTPSIDPTSMDVDRDANTEDSSPILSTRPADRALLSKKDRIHIIAIGEGGPEGTKHSIYRTNKMLRSIVEEAKRLQKANPQVKILLVEVPEYGTTSRCPTPECVNAVTGTATTI